MWEKVKKIMRQVSPDQKIELIEYLDMSLLLTPFQFLDILCLRI